MKYIYMFNYLSRSLVPPPARQSHQSCSGDVYLQVTALSCVNTVTPFFHGGCIHQLHLYLAAHSQPLG